MRRILLFTVMMGLAAAVAAQTYKWVDKDGKVRYGDQPPPGVKATPLKPPPPAPNAPSAAAAKKGGEKPLSPEAAFQKRQQEQREAEQKAAKAGTEDETKRTNCQQSQAALRGVESGQRITTTDVNGERVYLTDEQRDQEAVRLRQAVKEWCPR
jgi:hypothetical protein